MLFLQKAILMPAPILTTIPFFHPAAVLAAGLNVTIIYKLAVVAFILLAIMAYAHIRRILRRRGAGSLPRFSLFSGKRLIVTLEKNKLYFPDYLYLHIRNAGKSDIDIDKPLLIFSNFWLSRKFRLNGTNYYHFYPVYLQPGEAHDLTIDLQRFYSYDRRLKRFPKVSAVISDVKGKRVARQKIMLRKTLFT